MNKVASAALARPPSPPSTPMQLEPHAGLQFRGPPPPTLLPPHRGSHSPTPTPPNFLLLSPSRDANSIQWSGSSKVRGQKRINSSDPLSLIYSSSISICYRFHFGSLGRRTVGGKCQCQGRVWVHLPGCSGGGGPASEGCSSTASLCTESS